LCHWNFFIDLTH